MWVLLLLLFQISVQGISSPCAATSSTPLISDGHTLLIVQIVDDPGWMPIPGATVTVERRADKVPTSAKTDNDGYARFAAADESDYRIEANYTGFNRKRLDHVYIGKISGNPPRTLTAYVQLRLKLSGPGVTVY